MNIRARLFKTKWLEVVIMLALYAFFTATASLLFVRGALPFSPNPDPTAILYREVGSLTVNELMGIVLGIYLAIFVIEQIIRMIGKIALRNDVIEIPLHGTHINTLRRWAQDAGDNRLYELLDYYSPEPEGCR